MKKLAMMFLAVSCVCAFPALVISQISTDSAAPSLPQAVPAAAQQAYRTEIVDKYQVVQQVSLLGSDEMVGRIDWENKIVYAVGDGVPPKDAINPAQARARSKRAAIDEAYARLLETIQEVQVDANSTTRCFVNENRVVQTKVSGLIQNAEIQELKQASDGSYQVMMRMPMTGAAGLSSAILPLELANVNSNRKPAREQPSAATSIAKPPIPEKHTSLIVDTKGLGAKPAFYPVIQSESGEIVYDITTADPNATIEDGLCTYRKSMEETKKMPKIGERPLIVKALRVGGMSNVDIIVSDRDATHITECNKLNPFLKWANVNMVID